MGYIMDLRKELPNPHRPLIMCSAGIIIIDKKGRVLLQKRTDNNKWGLPGGSLELGESFEEAAIREAYEEVGLKVKSLSLFNVYSYSLVSLWSNTNYRNFSSCELFYSS